MFEAIHGSAPRRAGQDLANPSGLLLGAVMMLVHIGQNDVAERVHNAWLKTLEDGVHTYDIYKEGISTQKVGTTAFGQAVIDRIGQKPSKLPAVSYAASTGNSIHVKLKPTPKKKMETIGVDIFLYHDNRDPNALGQALSQIKVDFPLTMITNRGVKVYPDGMSETFCTDHWRCRFKNEDLTPVTYGQIIELQKKVSEAGYHIIKTENLCTFDGVMGFSAGQGA
jgi:isocitrate dehydrogenase